MKQNMPHQHAGQISVLGLFLVAMYTDSAIFREIMLIILPFYTMLYLAGLCKVDDIVKKYDAHFFQKQMLDIEFYLFSYRALSTMGISMRPPILERFFPNTIKMFFIYFVSTMYFLGVIHEPDSYPGILVASITISLVFSFSNSLLYRKKRKFMLGKRS
jgi:hypothetical protein